MRPRISIRGSVLDRVTNQILSLSLSFRDCCGQSYLGYRSVVSESPVSRRPVSGQSLDCFIISIAAQSGCYFVIGFLAIAFTLRHDDDIKYLVKKNIFLFIALVKRPLVDWTFSDYLERSSIRPMQQRTRLFSSSYPPPNIWCIGRGEVTLLLLQNDSPGLQTL